MGKFICKYSADQLKEMYNQPNMTLVKMCDIVGCKSTITMGKILNENGIDTNHNQKVAYKKRGNRTDDEFKEYLIDEYLNKKRSMTSIAKELNISWVIVSRYLDKYQIKKRTKSEQETGEYSPTWKGGIRKKRDGYIEIYSPTHPNANSRHCVYEHQLVAEKMIGRYLKKGEVVHHLDFNKSNNDPANLLVLTKSEHTKLHGYLRGGMPLEDALKEVVICTK